MSIKSFLFGIFLVFLVKTTAQSISYEAGFNFGTASFQTDYGERGDFESGVTGNMGLAVGASFYFNFFDKAGLWSDKSQWYAEHFKLKADVSYMKAELEHYGKYAEGTTETSQKLRAMHGTSSILNLGIVAEFHFMDLYNFKYKRSSVFDPYIGIGSLMSISKPTVTSDLGDYTSNPSVLPSVYQYDAIFTENQTIASFVFSAGTRVIGGRNGDLILDSRWQYFTSNRIDGLDPKLDANKFNDWLYTLSAGYVFYF